MSKGYIHQGHRERLRKRFILNGGKGMYDHELLELLLFYVIPRQNTNVHAHILIEHFGSLQAVLEASEEELLKVKGIGKSSARFIRMMTDFTDYFMDHSEPRTSLASTDDMIAYAEKLLCGASTDTCFIINLDMTVSVKNILKFDVNELLQDELDHIKVTNAILINAPQLVALVIDHGNELPIPNGNDFRMIQNIADTLSPLGISVYDAVICGRGKSISIRQTGAYSFK